jgi:hypothetical protein
MYQIELETVLPGTEQKVRVIACCRSIVDHDVIGLTLRFYDLNDQIMYINYDKEFFDEIEAVANDGLLEDFYNNAFGYMN